MSVLNRVFLANVHPPARSQIVEMTCEHHHPGLGRVVQRVEVMRYETMALRPFQKLKEIAFAHPTEFLKVVSSIKATGKRELCPSVLEARPCSHREKCPHAGSLAELYANQIDMNPRYKTEKCKFGARCRLAHNCHFGHTGDVMRKVGKVSKQLKS